MKINLSNTERDPFWTDLLERMVTNWAKSEETKKPTNEAEAMNKHPFYGYGELEMQLELYKGLTRTYEKWTNRLIGENAWAWTAFLVVNFVWFLVLLYVGLQK